MNLVSWSGWWIRGSVLGAALALAAMSCQGGGSGSKSPRPGLDDTPGVLVVDYADESADTFAVPVRDSILILDWLEGVTDSSGLALGTTEFAFGVLVEEIGPRRNGEGGYWLFTVNGETIPEAASRHRVAWTDTVRFFLMSADPKR